MKFREKETKGGKGYVGGAGWAIPLALGDPGEGRAETAEVPRARAAVAEEETAGARTDRTLAVVVGLRKEIK